MRILRTRQGFQADHSSSSYLFYAVDHPVPEKGQKIAHRYSSRAEVDDRTARYLKWGDASLSSDAFRTLLGEYYDVMASESYGWWTLMIAVPKTSEMKTLTYPFADARGYDDQGVQIEEYGERLVATVFCSFEADGANFGGYDDDPLEEIVELLTRIRSELIAGDVSFLQAVADFYSAEEDEVEYDEGGEDDEADEDEDERPERLPLAVLDSLSKGELQEQCEARGIEFRKSWTKARLLEALTPKAPEGRKPKARPAVSRLSEAGRALVAEMRRV
jgi:hypothetical protein